MLGKTSRLSHLWLILLFVASGFLNGCGDSENYVFTGTANNNPGGNTLTVNLDTAPVQARISGDAVTFEVSLYNSSLALVEVVTVPRGQSAVFQSLLDGTYTVRVIGEDANGDPVGYFDRVVNVGDDTSITIEGLIYTSTIPPIGSTDAPFLVITEVPDAITGGSDYDIEVTAYNANGEILTAATGNATLSATGVQPDAADGPQAFSNGRATFGVQFADDAEGNVSFTVSSPDLGSANSPSIPVSAAVPTDNPHLTFTTVPTEVNADEEFTVQVQLRDENDDLVTADGVAVTLAISGVPTPPVEGDLEGTLVANTVDGVATFSGLSFSLEGSYALTASATGYDSATSPTIVVEEALPVFTKLAVGDYTDGLIYIYSLTGLAAGNNDIAPIAIIGNGVDSEENYELESADGGNALWFSNDSDVIQLYTNLDDGDNMTNNDPAKVLWNDGDLPISSLAYDEGRDVLYAAQDSAMLPGVAIYTNAFDLATESEETALVSFDDYVYTVITDPESDRLFVFTDSAVAEAYDLHVFENASSLTDANESTIAHDVTTVTFPLNAAPFGGSYDAEHDRLYVADFNGETTFFYFLDDVASLGATATVSTVANGDPDPYFWDTAYDALNDTLYLSSYGSTGTSGSIAIYTDASTALTGPATTLAAPITISGANTLLSGPDGVTLLP